MGLTPIFNAEKKYISDNLNIFLNIVDLIYFISLCGNVIGVRTGLLDVIASFRPPHVNLQIIYPNDKHSVWREQVNLYEIMKDIDEQIDEHFDEKLNTCANLYKSHDIIWTLSEGNRNIYGHIYNDDVDSFVDLIVNSL